MKKNIKIKAFINYWRDKDEKQAELLSLLLEKKLTENKYRDKIKEVINEAKEELLKNN